MMLWLYTLAFYLALPLLLLLLAIRGLGDRNWLQRWNERFGLFKAPSNGGGIVIHAASVGEVNAASGLVRGLRCRFPGRLICITTFTPTGSERARSLFGDTIFHVYMPLDTPGAVRRFYRRVRPGLLIVVETEIWPNFLYLAGLQHIPVMIANGRISNHSIGRYRRLRGLGSTALKQVSRITACSETDATRYREIGAEAERIEVTGNIKFDLQIPDDLTELARADRVAWGENRPVLVAGSTHEREEDPVLEAFSGLLKRFPDALLVLAPRHPERFEHAARRARAIGLTVAIHSETGSCSAAMQCLLVDTMGQLLRYYAAGDVAFVGGSLEPIGGHNVLEPAALSRPVLVGPYTFNFEEITGRLLADGGAFQVNDARQLESVTARLFNRPELRKKMGHAGLTLVRSNQGALGRTVEIAAELITPITG